MSHPLRQLLPMGRGKRQIPESEHELPANPVPKRTSAKAACEACRRRKSKCNAERPKCSSCIERLTQCEYKTLPTETHLTAQKRRLSDLEAKCRAYENLYSILRTSPPDEASLVLRRVRSGVDVETVLQSIQEGDLLLQLVLRPEWRYRYDFPYLKEMPSFLGLWPNPYLRSTLHDRALISPSQHRMLTEQLITSEDEMNRMYLVPYHAVSMTDFRLGSVDVAKWTTVSSDNALLRALVEIYFVFEFPFHPFFHKELFLDDLLNDRHRFCSPLLVNAVLAAAWHGYSGIKTRADYWHPENQGYRFLSEAKRLLDLEQGLGKITTVQAAAIINLTCNINGVDELSWSYLYKSIEMAQRLQLFTVSPESSREWQVAANTTAWCLFNWQAFACFHNFRSPLLSEPPNHPLPTYGEAEACYGEIWVSYPASKAPIGICNGEVFVAVCIFRVILNDMAKSFKHSSDADRVPLDDAYSARGRLRVWYANLPEPLRPDRIVLPNHLKVHMHYHVLLISLFEQFQHVEVPDRTDSPASIVAEAKACFETLIRLYYLRHGFESYDVTLLQFLPMLASSSLHGVTEANVSSDVKEAIRSTILLCAKGLREQGKNYYICEAIFRLFRNSLSQQDAQLLMREVSGIEQEDSRMVTMISEIRSQWPIGVFSKTKKNADNTVGHFLNWWERMMQDKPRQASKTPDVAQQDVVEQWTRYER
ncbi:uncharacterized protein BCR38DRAFT_120679 [Pseudomassariella vexata]|uniref:Zn(2)-C6 fungal-type domain-containing protein n=1 Tax=Pseudomassariella vexata TaxID=1141098 RepID=A0A1Y2DAG0_9PEZI|nr:uncharacterized protein BCR38DRAFT_120679 [Pseudomassariella vexata]ORY56144.1 hypothetical protein BCR38DRAFT_120679 [Pseudomassariella vexata]